MKTKTCRFFLKLFERTADGPAAKGVRENIQRRFFLDFSPFHSNSMNRWEHFVKFSELAEGEKSAKACSSSSKHPFTPNRELARRSISGEKHAFCQFVGSFGGEGIQPELGNCSWRYATGRRYFSPPGSHRPLVLISSANFPGGRSEENFQSSIISIGGRPKTLSKLS